MCQQVGGQKSAWRLEGDKKPTAQQQFSIALLSFKASGIRVYGFEGAEHYMNVSSFCPY